MSTRELMRAYGRVVRMRDSRGRTNVEQMKAKSSRRRSAGLVIPTSGMALKNEGSQTGLIEALLGYVGEPLKRKVM